MNNLLTFIGVTLVVILTALFAVPLMVNWDNYRTDFEQKFSEILGAKVELDGSLNVRFLPAPYVRAENLRIGDSGVKGKPLLEVKELTLWVAVPPLLKGIIEASTLTLDTPKVILPFDQKGRPKWQAERYAAKSQQNGAREERKIFAQLSLSPQLISLKAVKIKKGEVRILTQTSVKKKPVREVTFGAVDGVLAAKTLNGPFYFNGKYLAEKAPRFVQLVIGAKDKDETYPLKAKLTLADKGFKFQLNGKLSGIGGELPMAEGVLKANLGVLANETPVKQTLLPQKAALGDTNAMPQLGGDEITFKSKVKVTPRGMDLNEMLLKAGSLARPQSVSGKAKIQWSGPLALEANANARLIDLNLILGRGTPPKIQPSEMVDILFKRVGSQASQFEKVDITARGEQIIVGEGELQKVKLTVSSSKGAVWIKDFSARLPGSSRASVKGVLQSVNASPLFKGDLLVRGLQFRKFLNWAVPETNSESDVGSGKFILAGRLKLNNRAATLSDIQGDVGGAHLRASLAYTKADKGVANPLGVVSKRGQVKLVVFADELDAAALLGKQVKIADIIDEFNEVDTPEVAEKKAIEDSKLRNVIIELAARRVLLEDASPSDVRFVWRGGAAGKGLELVEGRSNNGLKIQYQRGRGIASRQANYFIEANSKAALEDVFRWSRLNESFDVGMDATTRFLPLRLGLSLTKNSDTDHYRFDGIMGGSDVAFSLLVPRMSEGDTAPAVTILGGMERDDGAALLAQFLPGKFKLRVDETPVGPAKVTFSAHGDADRGFDGEIGILNETVSAKYQGNLKLENKVFAGDGMFVLEGEDSNAVLSLFGFGKGEGTPAPIKAQARFEKLEAGLAINDLKIGIGDKRIFGTGRLLDQEVSQGADGKIALAMDELRLGTLLGMLLEQSQDEGAAKLWSVRQFVGNKNENMFVQNGHYSITARELIVSDHLSLANARLEWRSMDDRIEIIKIEGEALGGQFKASGELRQGVGAYALTSVVQIVGGRLAEVGAASEASLGEGQFDLTLNLTGSGNSPSSLVENLVGEGFIKVSDGVISQITPQYIRLVADQFMKEAQGADFKIGRVIAEKSEAGDNIKIGSRDFALQVINGQISMQINDLGVKPGRLGLSSKLKLSDLSFASDWTFEPGVSKKGGKLPAVYKRVRGSLNSPDPLSAKFDVADLERHLSLRRQEIELRELEIEQRQQEELRRKAREEAERAALSAEEAEKKRIRNEVRKREQQRKNQDLNKTPLPPLGP